MGLEKERLVTSGWEIDIFKPPLQGIIIAEKEMKSVYEPLVLPIWIQGAIEVIDLNVSKSYKDSENLYPAQMPKIPPIKLPTIETPEKDEAPKRTGK